MQLDPKIQLALDDLNKLDFERMTEGVFNSGEWEIEVKTLSPKKRKSKPPKVEYVERIVEVEKPVYISEGPLYQRIETTPQWVKVLILMSGLVMGTVLGIFLVLMSLDY